MVKALFWGAISVGLIIAGLIKERWISKISLLLAGISIFLTITYAAYPVQDKGPIEAVSYLLLSLFNRTSSNSTVFGDIIIINHSESDYGPETTPISSPVSTSIPETPNLITTSPVSVPQSPYGKALQKEQLGQASYNYQEKASIIAGTYYARKNDSGVHKAWYTSTRFTDEDTGYQIGLYYADGELFFADAYNKGERSAVTFYFWNGHMFACQDIIGGETDLSYEGSSTYNRIVEQFGDIYAKSQQYAQDAK